MRAEWPSPELLEVWRFLRGDTGPKQFERWICGDVRLEDTFGEALYLELISASYSDHDAVRGLMDRLGDWARAFKGPPCRCITLADRAVVDMFDALVFATLQERTARGEPYWWLSARKCAACGDLWLVAQEERQNDVFCMRRLRQDEWLRVQAGEGWPTDFDRYEDLLRMGRDAGRSVGFVDPMNSRSLRWTVQDLAKARPGIRVSELASLLNLDPELASVLARAAVADEQVVITFDLE